MFSAKDYDKRSAAALFPLYNDTFAAKIISFVDVLFFNSSILLLLILLLACANFFFGRPSVSFIDGWDFISELHQTLYYKEIFTANN